MTADLYSWTEQEEEVRENLRVGTVTVEPAVSILQREQQDRAVFSPLRFCPSILNSEFYSVCIASPDLWRNRGLSLESLLWSPRAAVPPSPSLASLSVSLCCSVFAFPWAERAPRVFSTSTFSTFCAHLFHAGCPFSPLPSVRVSALVSFVCVVFFVLFFECMFKDSCL